MVALVCCLRATQAEEKTGELTVDSIFDQD
jgi:hypothetical protein